MALITALVGAATERFAASFGLFIIPSGFQRE
jgi:hypothetical protein